MYNSSPETWRHICTYMRPAEQCTRNITLMRTVYIYLNIHLHIVSINRQQGLFNFNGIQPQMTNLLF